MEVKEIVRTAMDQMAYILADENPTNIGFEEIIYDDDDKLWDVTVGFSRPWDYPNGTFVLGGRTQPARHYKIVKVNNEGDVVGIKIREIEV